jgi:hypothetical protein
MLSLVGRWLLIGVLRVRTTSPKSRTHGWGILRRSAIARAAARWKMRGGRRKRTKGTNARLVGGWYGIDI